MAQLIELAGGAYVFDDLPGSSGSATVTLEMEEFYARAKDADVIVYNGTIDGGVTSLAQLVEKNPLLAQFKAVQNGAVWCCDQNMYQQMIATGAIISDLHAAFVDDPDWTPTYLYRLS